MKLGFGVVLALGVLLAAGAANSQADKDRGAELMTDIAARCSLILDRQDPDPGMGLALVKAGLEALLHALDGDQSSFIIKLQTLEPRCRALVMLFTDVGTSGDASRSPSKPITAGTGNLDAGLFIRPYDEWLSGSMLGDQGVSVVLHDPRKQSGPARDRPNQASPIEPFFPWPPPEPFLFDVRERKSFPAEVKTLDQISERLHSALSTAGYSNLRFFMIQQDGFALVTQMERIDETGHSVNGPTRWTETGSLAIDVDRCSVRDWLLSIFKRRAGYFRVFVMIVTPETVRPDPDKKLNPETVQEWQRRGTLTLPDELGKQPFSDRHHVYVLIYEIKRDEGETPKMVEEGTATDHLKAAGIQLGKPW